MTRTRPYVLLILGVALLLPAGSASADDSGGAVAYPVPARSEGGGVVGPRAVEEPRSKARASDEPAAVGGGTPVARAGQDGEPTPTVPEGEEQNGAGGDEGAGSDPGVDEDGGGQDPAAEGEEITEGAPPAGEDSGGGALGFLPSTGAELAALAAIGLGLLMLGTALRPRPRA